MSVFTPVSLAEARLFLAQYGVGDILDFQNIAAGVENSNFFVTTTRSRYVLTIFEKIPRADLDFYIGLMRHLHQHKFACAAPIADRAGNTINTLHDKPIALVSRLEGGDIAHPTPDDCFAIGAALAKMHLITQPEHGFTLKMPNWRGAAWWQEYAAALAPLVNAQELQLLNDELSYQRGFDALNLPRGIIHGDLFRDNVLWATLPDTAPTDVKGTKVGLLEASDVVQKTPQMIDFYFACEEQFLFDVAITVNDWCLDFAAYPRAALDQTKLSGMRAGYESVRPWTTAEQAAWPQMLRAAALRTWLGRLGYHYFPRDSELTHPKDHPFSQRLLELHRGQTQ
jgi:homoserine kinase type II